MPQLDDLARLAGDCHFQVQFYRLRHLHLTMQHLHLFYIFRRKRRNQVQYPEQ